jgi:hypothetical protein
MNVKLDSPSHRSDLVDHYLRVVGWHLSHLILIIRKLGEVLAFVTGCLFIDPINTGVPR